jgi:YggT family protein
VYATTGAGGTLVGMSTLSSTAIILVEIFLVALLVRAVLSWFPGRGGALRNAVTAVTEPVMAPLRRVLPAPSLNGVSIDMSFLAVFLGARLLVIPLLAALG